MDNNDPRTWTDEVLIDYVRNHPTDISPRAELNRRIRNIIIDRDVLAELRRDDLMPTDIYTSATARLNQLKRDDQNANTATTVTVTPPHGLADLNALDSLRDLVGAPTPTMPDLNSAAALRYAIDVIEAHVITLADGSDYFAEIDGTPAHAYLHEATGYLRSVAQVQHEHEEEAARVTRERDTKVDSLTRRLQRHLAVAGDTQSMPGLRELATDILVEYDIIAE